MCKSSGRQCTIPVIQAVIPILCVVVAGEDIENCFGAHLLRSAGSATAAAGTFLSSELSHDAVNTSDLRGAVAMLAQARTEFERARMSDSSVTSSQFAEFCQGLASTIDVVRALTESTKIKHN